MSNLTADARNRATRTFVQGLVATVLIAGLSALVEWLTAGGFSLRTLGVAAATACATAALSYLQRAYLDPYREVRAGTPLRIDFTNLESEDGRRLPKPRLSDPGRPGR